MLVVFCQNSQANILISKTFVKFEQNKNTQIVEVTNNSKEEKKYKAYLVNFDQNEDGSYKEIKEGDIKDYTAINLLYISPKIFTLKPKESQAIKLFKKNANFINSKDGEYRTHLYVQELENDIKPESQAGSGSISLNINTLFGVSIPIILTKGNLTHKTNIEKAQCFKNKEGKPEISITLQREGNASSRGDIDIYLGNKKVAFLKNINLFYPNLKRSTSAQLFMDLDKNSESEVKFFDNKNLTIKYTEKTKEDSQSSILIDSKSFKCIL